MCLRWTAAGMLEAKQQFRKIIGYPDLAKLAVAVERDVAARRAADTPTSTAHTTVATTAPEIAASPA
jgi:putative transposase